MFQEKSKMTPARKTFAAVMFAGLTAFSAVAGTQEGSVKLDMRDRTVSVEAEWPSLIRFEGTGAGQLDWVDTVDWVKAIDRSPNVLLVAVEEAGFYEFRASNLPLDRQGHEDLDIDITEVEIIRDSFWAETSAGRLAIDRTTYRALSAWTAKNEEETNPDPDTPPSGGGWTAHESAPLASYIEVRRGFQGQGLLTMALSSWTSAADLEKAARLGSLEAVTSALITRPRAASKNEEETNPDPDTPPHKNEEETNPDPDTPPHKNEEETNPDPDTVSIDLADSWRVLVAGDAASHLEIAAWAAPLTWTELSQTQQPGLRLVSFGAVD